MVRFSVAPGNLREIGKVVGVADDFRRGRRRRQGQSMRDRADVDERRAVVPRFGEAAEPLLLAAAHAMRDQQSARAQQFPLLRLERGAHRGVGRIGGLVGRRHLHRDEPGAAFGIDVLAAAAALLRIGDRKVAEVPGLGIGVVEREARRRREAIGHRVPVARPTPEAARPAGSERIASDRESWGPPRNQAR